MHCAQQTAHSIQIKANRYNFNFYYGFRVYIPVHILKHTCMCEDIKTVHSILIHRTVRIYIIYSIPNQINVYTVSFKFIFLCIPVYTVLVYVYGRECEIQIILTGITYPRTRGPAVPQCAPESTSNNVRRGITSRRPRIVHTRSFLRLSMETFDKPPARRRLRHLIRTFSRPAYGLTQPFLSLLVPGVAAW